MYGPKGKFKGTAGKISVCPSEKYGIFMVKNLVIVTIIKNI